MHSAVPFVSRDALVEAYRPAQGFSDAALKTLKRHRLLSEGISVPLRDAGAGRMSGRLHLYSALVRDAARVARLGDEARAWRLIAAGQRIERLGASQSLAVTLGEACKTQMPRSGFPLADLTDRLSALSRDRATRNALIAVTRATERARASLAPDLAIPFFVQVSKLHGSIAEVRDSHGRALRIPMQDWEWARQGRWVAMYYEDWGRGKSFVFTEPALELSSAQREGLDPGTRAPFRRRDDDEDDRSWAVLESLSYTEPTIRRPRRIPIEG